MTPVPAFSSAADAMATVRAGLGFLAGADATQMPVQTQAECLQMLEQATAMGTAARTSILAAFTSAQGYSADADYSPRAWLVNRTRVTKAAAVGYTAWVRRAAGHPRVAAVLAAGEMSESYARAICGWAWLDGDAAAAMACDAAMAPVVTWEVNPAALEDLILLCVQLDWVRHDPGGTGEGGTAGNGTGARAYLPPTPRGRGRRWSRP